MENENKKSQIAAILILTIFIIGTFICYKYSEKQDFNVATTNILNGQYEKAKNILRTISESDKRNSLLSLCDVYIEFNSGNISRTRWKLEEIKNDFVNTSLEENVNTFYTIVEKEYNNYLAEKKQAEEEAKTKRSQSPPYVGMAESYINDTSWGIPNKVEKCANFKYLDYRHRSIKYYWYNIDSELSFAVATVYYDKDGKQSDGFIYWLDIYCAKSPYDNKHLQYGK